MLQHFYKIVILSVVTTSFSFANTVTFQSFKGGSLKLNGTYTFTKQNEADISTDGKLSLIKIIRIRNKSARTDAYIYDAWDKMVFNGSSYKIHFVSMTENDGKAFGIFKIFNASGASVDMGNYTYISDVKPSKTGKL